MDCRSGRVREIRKIGSFFCIRLVFGKVFCREEFTYVTHGNVIFIDGVYDDGAGFIELFDLLSYRHIPFNSFLVLGQLTAANRTIGL